MNVKKIERKCIERNSKDRIVIDIKRDKKNGSLAEWMLQKNY